MANLAQIVAQLGGDLGSPRVVDDIDRVMVHLFKMRQMAADLHGINAPAPFIPASEAALNVPEVFSADEPKAAPASDRDIAAIVNLYRNDPRSPYQRLRHRTRINYDGMLRRINEGYGRKKLADLRQEDFEQFYISWKGADGTKTAMAHQMITMLRSVIGFGAEPIADRECLRLSVILHKMKFQNIKPRIGERLTEQHVVAIRTEAHKAGYPSIALAQALQFDCQLPQKDVVGEWVPLSEQGPPSVVTNGDMKWLRGLLWSEIDEHFVLRHVRSADEERLEIDLRSHPMVMAELWKMAGGGQKEGLARHMLPSGGRPLIIDTDTDLPYLPHKFRRTWRKIATSAGVPSDVENRDSLRPVGKWTAWHRKKVEDELKSAQ